MKAIIKGGGEFHLNKNNFVASGGEGAIYVKGSIAFKIYSNQSKIIPQSKIEELSKISDACVIKPESLVLSDKGAYIGYCMRYIKDTYSLCQLFTRSFKERNNIDNDKILDLIKKIQNTIKNIHKAGVLIVDLNEMNLLLDHGLNNTYFIDVDSYETKSFPATAIMPSVRDWHTPIGKFNEYSDWFSFAILAFQLFIGIHPYKGKHPSIKELEERMKNNISVFNKDVKMPRVCFPIDIIPPIYRNWFKAEFEGGKRLPPPEELVEIIKIIHPIKTISSTEALEIEKSEKLDDIKYWFESLGSSICVARKELYFNGRVISSSPQGKVSVGFTKKLNTPIVSYFDRGFKLFNALNKNNININLNVDQFSEYDGRIYVKIVDKVFELSMLESANQIIASPGKIVANVLEHASKLYQGVIIQNLLGSIHVSVLQFEGLGIIHRIKELDGLKIIDAKFDNRILMIITADKKSYNRIIIKFDQACEHYEILRTVKDIPTPDINFITLESGICVCLNEEEKLEVFSNKIGNNSIKIVEDDIISGEMRLIKYKNKVGFIKDGNIFTMRMK